MECQTQIKADHDQFLEPAYRSAIDTASRANRVGRWNGARGEEAYVGDNGVLVIVNSDGRFRRKHVSTAYRVRPLGVKLEEASAQDFFEAAVRKLKDRSSFMDGGPDE